MTRGQGGRKGAKWLNVAPCPRVKKSRRIMRNGKASDETMKVSMPQGEGPAYAGVVSEGRERSMAVATPAATGRHAVTPTKSEGGEHGSVVGCNANNGNASARTANCNNAASNGNDNYAGAFALVNGNVGTSTSRAASTKTTDSPAVTDGQGRCDYGSCLPFWGEEEIAESNATATDKDPISEALSVANSKRKLKNLKRFFTDKTLIAYAFDRTMQSSSAKKADKDLFIANRQAIIDRIAHELETQTYEPQPAERRVIRKRGKGDKARNADVYTLYDRIVQMLILIVIEGKFRHMMIRNIYSGIKGRSLLSNNRTYCMVNRIRTWVKGHHDSWVGLTDIRHFYESLRVKVVLGEMFSIIVCPFTRWLLCTAFSKTEYLPIGGCLSQLMGMFAIVGADREVLNRYRVKYFAFGDNRLMGGDKQEVRKAMSFLMSYYEGRYGLSVKGDYQLRKVSDGFRFCKYDFRGSYVHVRAEMRRRAIRAYRRGWQHYAGYRGMLLKTDSQRLRQLIETSIMELTNKHGMTVRTQRGDKQKLRDLRDDAEIFPVEYLIEKSEAKAKEGKEGLMVRLTYILIDGEKKRLCHSTEGSEEIVEFFRLAERGETEPHQRLHVRHDGTRSYFREYHTSKEEACDILCDMFGL